MNKLFFIVPCVLLNIMVNTLFAQSQMTQTAQTPTLLASQRMTVVEQKINQAVIAKDWRALPVLLARYQQFPQYDVTLWKYARGAMAYKQKNHRLSIRLYREIIADNPTLNFARFDLAVMLFENKQLTAAKTQFRKVKAATTEPVLLKMSDKYLQAINRADSWDFDFSANYRVNDNVNNASSSPTITVGNATFRRTKDSLPKKGHGIDYAFSASRDWNMIGSHYLSSDFRLNGDYYWDAKDYQQTQVRADIGYRYQSVDNTFSLRPFVSTLWYGGKHYTNTVGVDSSIGHWVDRHWQVNSGLTLSKQYYMDSDYRRYDNDSVSLRSHVTYIPSAKQYWLLGVSFDNANAEDVSESQNTHRIYLGWGYEWSLGVSSRINTSYAKRTHDAPHYLYGYRRQDSTKQLDVTLWKRDWHFRGLTPKLTYSYQKTKSNMPDLYNRKNSQFFLTVEKSF